MRRHQRGQLGQHSDSPRRTTGAGAHDRAVPAQAQDQRGLAGLVSVLPHPGTGRVGGPERRLHGGAQDGGIEGLTPLRCGQQQPSGVEDSGCRIGRSGRGWDANIADCSTRAGTMKFMAGFRRAGFRGRRALSRAHPARPVLAVLSLCGRPVPQAITRSGALVPAHAVLYMTN